MALTLKRHPTVPDARLSLSEQAAETQIKKGLRVVERGEPFALPVDRVSEPTVYQDRKLWVKSPTGVHRRGVRLTAPSLPWIPKFWKAADAVTGGRASYARNMLAFGHDVHVTQYADLYARHWHAGWADPFTGETVRALDPTFASLRDTHWKPHDCDLPTCWATVWPEWETALTVLQGRSGFVEECGWVSGALITSAFVNVEVGALADSAGTGEAAEFNDFNEHEVGTSAVAESNAHTALQTSSGIALVAGTQVDAGGAPPVYTSVATITADATETWEEHGVFSTTADSMMDRNLTGGQGVTASDQVEYTYNATINPET